MTFKLDKVTFAYRKKEPVLRGLSFAVQAGTTAILGQSGVGKTTLLSLLALLWDRALKEGNIFYTSPRTGLETNYAEMSLAERARVRGRDFGLVPQAPLFLPGFTCRQNVSMPLFLQGQSRASARDRVAQLLNRVACEDAGTDLARSVDHLPAAASTGQLQRLAALRAVVHEPVVLFADEPVSNLDAENKKLLLKLFQSWQKTGLSDAQKPPATRTLILVCHETDTAWEMADQFLFLHPARKGEPTGATSELISKKEFQAAEAILDSEAARCGPEALRRRIREGQGQHVSDGPPNPKVPCETAL